MPAHEDRRGTQGAAVVQADTMLQQLKLDVTTTFDRPIEPDSVPQDSALLSAIAAGDSAALSLLYDRYSSLIFSLALRMLGSQQAAEEIVQDAFLRVWRRSELFQPTRGSVIQWLFGITHHLCVDELRRRKSRAVMVLSSEAPSLLDAQPNQALAVDEEVWLRERRQIIRGALAELPIEQRQVIELAYIGGLSQSEIAERTGEPLGTVKTRVRLALRKLKDILTARHNSDI